MLLKKLKQISKKESAFWWKVSYWAWWKAEWIRASTASIASMRFDSVDRQPASKTQSGRRWPRCVQSGWCQPANILTFCGTFDMKTCLRFLCQKFLKKTKFWKIKKTKFSKLQLADVDGQHWPLQFSWSTAGWLTSFLHLPSWIKLD